MGSLDQLRDTEVRIHFAGGGVAGIDGRAFAVLTPEPPAGSWKLVSDEARGENHFVIIDAVEGFGKGLKLADPEEADAQVEVGFIPVGKSLPPFYPPNAVWVLDPSEDDDGAHYRLRNLASNTYIGRRAAEDGSSNPKPIVVNPQPQNPEKMFAAILPVT
ncbi:I66 family serine proteinase inhibitor [Streptomyces purpurogeneiscleroticus]|uniref:I66 family serine proteinase inhibitor n=1 Tax=Streptomyces purpurogeneiscleroticus TaxID=68259 RepID=UPI001CBD02FD|nr:I66 family serine proteinase inhibitor [Streptomyces purpurogeneiscleroticus]MBZ4016255.1 hypothetical protein [Streptomyces purpurogeneiscleroticus]